MKLFFVAAIVYVLYVQNSSARSIQCSKCAPFKVVKLCSTNSKNETIDCANAKVEINDNYYLNTGYCGIAQVSCWAPNIETDIIVNYQYISKCTHIVDENGYTDLSACYAEILTDAQHPIPNIKDIDGSGNEAEDFNENSVTTGTAITNTREKRDDVTISYTERFKQPHILLSKAAPETVVQLTCGKEGWNVVGPSGTVYGIDVMYCG